MIDAQGSSYPLDDFSLFLSLCLLADFVFLLSSHPSSCHIQVNAVNFPDVLGAFRQAKRTIARVQLMPSEKVIRRFS